MASTLRMRTTISPGQWQPWTAVSPLYVCFSAVIGMLSKPSWIPFGLEILFQASEKKNQLKFIQRS